MQKYNLILDTDRKKHPAWMWFVADMDDRSEFELMAINLAWAFFKQGWEAHHKWTSEDLAL